MTHISADPFPRHTMFDGEFFITTSVSAGVTSNIVHVKSRLSQNARPFANATCDRMAANGPCVSNVAIVLIFGNAPVRFCVTGGRATSAGKESFLVSEKTNPLPL